MRHFLIIGAMKAGTSSLYEHLATHPEIFASPIKEPSFYTKEAPTANEVSEYRSLFDARTNEKCVFEASTNYAKYPKFSGVPGRIHDACPDIRLIYMLRDPIARIYSHWIMSYGRGWESHRLRHAVFSNPHYLNTSRYYMQISQYLKVFQPHQLLPVVFEEFIQDKPRALRRIFEFLEVDPDFVPPNLDTVFHASTTHTMLPPLLQRLAYSTRSISRTLNRMPLVGGAYRRACVPFRWMERPWPRRDDIADGELDAELRNELSNDIDQLEEVVGRKLNCWT